MGAAAVHPGLPARRALGSYVGLQLASTNIGAAPHARILCAAPRPTASFVLPSALPCAVAYLDSYPASTARPCISHHHHHRQRHLSMLPCRLRRPSNPWQLPLQPGCAPLLSRACQSRAAHHRALAGAGAPRPDSIRAARDPRGTNDTSGSTSGNSSSSSWVSFFATCHPGLEQVVARELVELGYTGVEPSKAGVAFRGSRVSDGYAANLWLRSAIRVLVLLAEGELGADPRAGVRGGQALYDMVYGAAPWHELIPEGATFSVEPRLWSCTDISSTRLVWSRVKDAVCDSIRRYRREKPSPPERGEVADVPLYVSCYRDRVRIFRDMSGTSLHRRGYRDVMHRAALNEAAAAGVLALSGWREALEAGGDGEGLVLADPMCGSGTLLIEAALMARDIAPGLIRSLALEPPAGQGGSSGEQQQQQQQQRGGAGGRRNAALATDAWPFQRWGDYEPAAWGAAVEEARERVRPPWRGRLLGFDVHQGALSLAVRQAKKAGVYNMVELGLGDCGSVVPAAVPNLVVCNPPWGARLDGGDGYDGGDDGYDDGYGSTARDYEYDGDGHDGYPGDGDAGGHLGVVPRDVAAAAASARRLGGGGGGAAASPDQEAFLAAAWRSLDGFLYRQCPGASATVVSGNSAAFRYLKLKPQSKHRLVLSGVDVQVASYKIRDAASRSSPPATAAAVATAAATQPAEPPSAAASAPAAAKVPPGHHHHLLVPADGADATLRDGATEPAAGPPQPPTLASPPSPATDMTTTTGTMGTTGTAAGTARLLEPAGRRKAVSPPPPPPPPTSPGDYLDADDGYWLS